MADIAREMEDFKAVNRTFGGEWKLEMKGGNTNCSSSNQPSSYRSSSVPDPPPPQPICLWTPSSTCKDIDKYNKSYYNYSKSNVTRGVGDLELKRQRRLVKYKSYVVERQLKSSLMGGFRWMKNKYCEFVLG
ncbi:hypothetical protein REPUB_Repub20aG0134500 [Reevesia pubescens]